MPKVNAREGAGPGGGGRRRVGSCGADGAFAPSGKGVRTGGRGRPAGKGGGCAEDFSQIRGQKGSKSGGDSRRRDAQLSDDRAARSGKTMIARRIPGILPGLTLEESLRITKIYSVAGLLPPERLLTRRPFRAPHHTTTAEALAGAETAAAGGDFPEHRRHSLPGRASGISPLRSGDPGSPWRSTGSASPGRRAPMFPADFMLVAAMNPCACGYYPDRTAAAARPGRFPGIWEFKPASSGPHRYLYAGAKLSYEELQKGEKMKAPRLSEEGWKGAPMQKERFRGLRSGSIPAWAPRHKASAFGTKEKKLLKEALTAVPKRPGLSPAAAGGKDDRRPGRGGAGSGEHILEALGYRPWSGANG